MTSTVRVVHDTYADSLLLLVATSEMSRSDGVSWAGAVMATPTGRESLRDEGFGPDVVGELGSNDLVLAIRADDDEAAERGLDAGVDAVFAESPAGETSTAESQPRSIRAAVAGLDGANVAIVSVPGAYAALEAHHALTEGLHVLLFSDNVPLLEEKELKERADRLGLLVMGPGAGTAVLGGTGLGFANSVRRGSVGVIAAAGTGAQEVAVLLDRWGVGVSHVIGVGGRDLSDDIGGLMAKAAVRALAADPGTSAILLVSKPPGVQVAKDVLHSCVGTPTVATFLGLVDLNAPDGVHLARTLEEGALAAATLVGRSEQVENSGLVADVERAIGRLSQTRRTVRGYYSGGTLCYEAQLVIGDVLGHVHSNEPLVPENTVPAPPGTHVLLDLGAEEYTDGRPHPMIDPSARIDLIRAEARDDDVAVVLLDVVLGFGSHQDPAGQLLEALTETMADGGPQVVAYVLGSENDPQNYAEQCAKLADIGCIVTRTAARAAYAAAAIASRRPELAR